MIRIRVADPQKDASRILEIYSYYIEKTVSFEYPVPSVEKYKDFMREILRTYPFLVIEEEGLVIGYSYASAFRKRAAYYCSIETTIYFDHHYLRKGYGSLLYQSLLKLLKKQGFANAYACIVYPYDISVNFHQKNGFRQCGLFYDCAYKDKEWLSVIYMVKRLINQETEQEYKEPVAFSELDRKSIVTILESFDDKNH